MQVYLNKIRRMNLKMELEEGEVNIEILLHCRCCKFKKVREKSFIIDKFIAGNNKKHLENFKVGKC